MNNAAPILTPRRSKDQQDCVEVLTDALDEAVKGRITSIALVVCMDDGIATILAGKNGGALNMGCDDLKVKIHAAMFGAKASPSILRAKN